MDDIFGGQRYCVISHELGDLFMELFEATCALNGDVTADGEAPLPYISWDRMVIAQIRIKEIRDKGKDILNAKEIS